MNLWWGLLLYVVATVLFAWLTGRAVVKAQPELEELGRALVEFKKALKEALKEALRIN